MKSSDSLELASALGKAYEYARRGDIESAEAIALDLRKQVNIQDHPKMAVRTMLLEGMVYAYRCEWEKSIDRLRRARLLSFSQEFREEEIQAVAWEAYVRFNADDLEQAAQDSLRVLRERDADAFSVCRASLVLASIFQYVGDIEKADRWFSISKRAAELAGDSSQTSIVIFNIVATRVSAERFRRTCDGTAFRDLTLELLFARSSQNFDKMGGIRVIEPLHVLLQAEILNLNGDYSTARDTLSSLMCDQANISSSLRSRFILEWIWCRANLVFDDQLNDELSSIHEVLADLRNDDEIAVAYARLARIEESRGNSEAAQLYSSQSQEACIRYGSWCKEFSAELTESVRDLWSIRSRLLGFG